MRTVYALVIVFLILSIFFARWYLCDIRGLCTFPGDQFVGDKMTAIIEILVMMLVTFLIGFAAAWLLREDVFQKVRQQAVGLLKEWGAVQTQLKALEKENQLARKHVAEWQAEIQNLGQGRKFLEENLSESQSKISTLEQEIRDQQRRYENLKSENDAIRESAIQVKKAADPTPIVENQVIVQQVVEPEKKKETGKPYQSRFTPSTWQTRDDLTLISGIGPAIQRKLNEIGIYSFQQISEFTPEDIDRVASALKVFKGRIGRDNWIGQAAALRIK